MAAAEHAAALSMSAADDLRNALAAAQADHAASLQELEESQQRAEVAEQHLDSQAATLQSIMEEVGQMRARLQCMSGQDEALAGQPLSALEALEALLEAALPRIRSAVTRRRVEAARTEAAAAAAAAQGGGAASQGMAQGGGGSPGGGSGGFGGGAGAAAAGGAQQERPGAETRGGRDTRRQQQQGNGSSRAGRHGADEGTWEGAGTSGGVSNQHAAQQGGSSAQGSSGIGSSSMGQIDEEAAEREQCAVCLSSPRNTVLGCGHLFCRDCAARLTRCAICRAPITSRGPAFV